jgi:hypothetical protein
MAAALPRRVEFSKGKLLTSADLEDEQLYHLTVARRHRIGAHSWGVVSGLTLEVRSQEPFLANGYAVDGFGRDLWLESPLSLASRLRAARLEAPRADRFLVALVYDRERNAEAANRWQESPRIVVRPPEEFPEPPALAAGEVPPDAPDAEWPVPVGLLMRDPEQGWQVDMTGATRREAGLIASRVYAQWHDEAVRNQKTRLDLENGFAVYLDGHEAPSLQVDQRGATIGVPVRVEGGIELDGSLSLAPGTLVAGAPWAIYRDGDAAAAPDTHELRVVLPDQTGRFVVGALDPDKQEFKPILEVGADRTVTVHGDLIVEGFVETIPPGSIEPDPRAGAGAGPTESTQMQGFFQEMKLGAARGLGPIVLILGLLALLTGAPFSSGTKSWSCQLLAWFATNMGLGPYTCPTGTEPEDRPAVEDVPGAPDQPTAEGEPGPRTDRRALEQQLEQVQKCLDAIRGHMTQNRNSPLPPDACPPESSG